MKDRILLILSFVLVVASIITYHFVQDTVSSLEAEILDLEAEKHIYQVELKETEDELREFKDLYAQAKREAFELSNSLLDYTKDVHELEQEIEKLEKELEEDSVSYIDVEATYYTAFCNTGCDGETATGLDVSETVYHPEGYRVVAVDPNVIPLGTVMKIETPYNEFKAIAADTGGAIVGNKIDILVATKDEAFDKGVVNAKVEILY